MNLVKCLQCNIETTNPRFCSQSCSATYNNIIRGERTAKTCLFCSKRMSGHQWRVQKYCSQTCSHAWRRREKIARWLNGENITESEYCVKFLRDNMLEDCGYRCQSPTCYVPGGWSGINPTTGRSTLQMDHIDGNAKNNRRNNLQILCPNCHTLTPTFGSLNNGNGRSYRYPSIEAQQEKRLTCLSS